MPFCSNYCYQKSLELHQIHSAQVIRINKTKTLGVIINYLPQSRHTVAYLLIYYLEQRLVVNTDERDIAKRSLERDVHKHV